MLRCLVHEDGSPALRILHGAIWLALRGIVENILVTVYRYEFGTVCRSGVLICVTAMQITLGVGVDMYRC